MSDIRFPIGNFLTPAIHEDQWHTALTEIAQLPYLLEKAIENLDTAQLNTAYRPGGWTVNEVVHHVVDSHINAYCRMKLTLTEDNPTIRPYEETAWVQLADATTLPVNNALTLLHALHQRLYALLKSTTAADWERTYTHPATGTQQNFWFLVNQYAWHGKHHTAHITHLKERMGWK